DSAGFADADAHPEDEELPEGCGDTAEAREGAPDRDRRGDDPAATGAGREQGEGNAEDRIEDREGRAAQQAELPVVQMKIGDDRAGENADDLPGGRDREIRV